LQLTSPFPNHAGGHFWRKNFFYRCPAFIGFPIINPNCVGWKLTILTVPPPVNTFPFHLQPVPFLFSERNHSYPHFQLGGRRQSDGSPG
jgi:hypothetical protein